jgi:hypothetical protein
MLSTAMQLSSQGGAASSSMRRHATLVPMRLLLPHAVPGEVARGRGQRPDGVPRDEPATLLRQQARVTRLEPGVAVRVLRLVTHLPRDLSNKRRVVGQRQKLQLTIIGAAIVR